MPTLSILNNGHLIHILSLLILNIDHLSDLVHDIGHCHLIHIPNLLILNLVHLILN